MCFDRRHLISVVSRSRPCSTSFSRLKHYKARQARMASNLSLQMTRSTPPSSNPVSPGEEYRGNPMRYASIHGDGGSATPSSSSSVGEGTEAGTYTTSRAPSRCVFHLKQVTFRYQMAEARSCGPKGGLVLEIRHGWSDTCKARLFLVQARRSNGQYSAWKSGCGGEAREADSLYCCATGRPTS